MSFQPLSSKLHLYKKRDVMKLTIPTPCHENWDAMSPNKQGRFCSVCTKTVRDFSSTSDEEIVEVFSENPENVCGHFKESQLNRDLSFSYVNSLLAKFTIGFIVTAGGFVSVQAQQCESKQDTLKKPMLKGKVVSPALQDSVRRQNMVLGGMYAQKVRSNPPLYVMDGKIISEEELKKIDSHLIKSVHVLKGETATQQYGDKGNNGVIVMTRKGKH